MKHAIRLSTVCWLGLLCAGQTEAAQLTPTWQSRFINVAADAVNMNQETEDGEAFHIEAPGYDQFATYQAATALVDGAQSAGVASQNSQILADRILADGTMFASAEAWGDSTSCSGIATSWTEVSFLLDEAAEVELLIYLHVVENAIGAVQLWEETPDGPVVVRAEHAAGPDATVHVTYTNLLESGEYRLRAQVQGGAWSNAYDGEFESAAAQYTAHLTILDNLCMADLDGDGDTDQADLGVLLASYGVDDGGDLDGDGDTDQADLGVLLADYGCA